MTKVQSRRLGFEVQERRLCLAIDVAVEDGVLSVTGEADGAVEIVATDAGTFEVRDAGALIDTATEVEDIKVRLDDTETNADHTLSIDLGGQSVRRLFVDLDDGNNTFTLSGGSVDQFFAYLGGDGNDAVTIAADAVVERGAAVRLGDGDNTLTVAGTLGRELLVHGGDDADTVTVEEGAVLERGMIAKLGNGSNATTIAGQVDRSVAVFGGVDDDTLDILATAAIDRSVTAALGGGDNSLTVAGTIEGSLSYDGRGGNDTVTLEESAVVERNVDIKLGDGDNGVSHQGAIGGNLRVVSANEDDVVDISDREDAVGGRTRIDLGGQHEGHGRFGPHGHGPFGFHLGAALGRAFGFGRWGR